MPVSFLTTEQERRYGRYAGEPTSNQLARYFHLDDADRELAGAKRSDPMRLGYAVQLGTVRFLGTFLEDPSDVPPGVTGDLARQLGITDPRCLTQYREGRAKWQHAREIRAGFGYASSRTVLPVSAWPAGCTPCAGPAPTGRASYSTVPPHGW